MPKCGIALRHGCSPVNLLHIFRAPFPRNTSGWLLLVFSLSCILSYKDRIYDSALTWENKGQ